MYVIVKCMLKSTLKSTLMLNFLTLALISPKSSLNNQLTFIFPFTSKFQVKFRLHDIKLILPFDIARNIKVFVSCLFAYHYHQPIRTYKLKAYKSLFTRWRNVFPTSSQYYFHKKYASNSLIFHLHMYVLFHLHMYNIISSPVIQTGIK